MAQTTALHTHYEEELPAGYTAVKVVDCKSKKTAILLNVGAAVITLVALGVSVLLTWEMAFIPSTAALFSLTALLVLYLVLHELVHGLVYFLLTRHKLTFGLSLSCAYCGVPDIYVYRRTAMLSLAAPLTVFTLVFLAAALLFPQPEIRLCSLVLLSCHLGGCVGDIYDLMLYLFRFRSPDTLMKDTGPCQTFYLREESHS